MKSQCGKKKSLNAHNFDDIDGDHNYFVDFYNDFHDFDDGFDADFDDDHDDHCRVFLTKRQLLGGSKWRELKCEKIIFSP